MSNVYQLEPPTEGKVLLTTSHGEIEVELWPKEAPKACRNFVQLCMEGYYDGCIFHRIIKDFMIQTGDPTGTGHGGESIYGEPFKDELHSRIKFNHRGQLAMANAGGRDTNGSQFFIISGDRGAALPPNYTLFGEVIEGADDTLVALDAAGNPDSNGVPPLEEVIIESVRITES